MTSGRVDAAVEEPASATSLQLLLRARRGDREALNQLFERMAGPLRRWARGRLPRWARGRADTADMVQETLVHALGRLGQFEPQQRHALRAYLRQGVMNRIRDEVRWAGRRRPVDVDSLDLAAPTTAFDEAVDEENLSRYRAAMSTLDPADRELIVARLELGYSYDQIALATGRSTPNGTRMAIRRALLRLADAMAPR